jgi:alpha-beta hydrolase superfamily lysophospholipase
LAESIEIFTHGDGYQTYTRRYNPDGTPLAKIVYLHGIQSHAGWYTRSCQHLAAAGIEVLFVERRGSGWNSAYRGDVRNFRRWVEDVQEILTQEKCLNLFLGAISWGAKVATLIASEWKQLAGLILLTPGLIPRDRLTFPDRLLILAKAIIAPKRYLPIPFLEPEKFTRSREWIHFLKTDRYTLNEVTARFLVQTAILDRKMRSAIKRIQCPMLMQLAEDDQIVDNHRTRQLIEMTKGSRSIIEYPGAMHTLEFEEETHPFVADQVNWIKSHLFRASTRTAD